MTHWIIHGVLVLALLYFVLLARRQASTLRYYRSLAQLAGIADGGLNSTEAGRRLLALLMATGRATAGLLYWQEDEVGGLRLKACQGMDQNRLGQAAIDPWLRRQLAELRARGGNRVVDLIREGDALFAANFSAIMAVLLPVGEKLAGVVLLFRETGRFKPRKRALLSRYSTETAAAFAAARFSQRGQTVTEENARLYLNLSKLTRQATVDKLTGLVNHNHMQQRLKEEIKKSWRFKQLLSVVLIDLDLFRRVNEVHGNKLGDEVLREVAGIVRKTARDYDIACRYGGEEILLILPQTDNDGALALSERLRREIGEHSYPEDVTLTCSLGVATTAASAEAATSNREDGTLLSHTVENLLSQAEQALASAKEAGRNRVETAAGLDP